jgi:hypothetical protein
LGIEERTMNDLDDLIGDLEVLAKAAQHDFTSQRWETYDRNIEEYNQLLHKVRPLGIVDDLPALSTVPKEERPMFGAGTTAEIAKAREVATKCEQLLTRLQRRRDSKPETVEPLALIQKTCERTHAIARQLRSRYDKRPTLDVQDEYDLQDLLHVLLRVHFNDIRPEEYTPSYAGKSSRMDFLLKDFDIVVETKHTRDSLTEKEVGTQLIEDIARYKSHPDCKTMFCFVYDPSGRIANPHGLEGDLSSDSEDLSVQVYVGPK